MDVALGVAVTDRVARLALVDSAAPGTVIDQFVLDVAEHPVEVLTETVVGTDRSLAGENHRLVATRLCWPDQAKADELQHALQDSGVHDVAVISEAQAATALVGAAHAGSAVLLVGDETATLSVVGDPDAPPTMVAVAPVAGADATSTVDTLMARLGDQALAPGDVFLVGRSAEHTTVLADQLRAASTMRVQTPDHAGDHATNDRRPDDRRPDDGRSDHRRPDHGRSSHRHADDRRSAADAAAHATTNPTDANPAADRGPADGGAGSAAAVRWPQRQRRGRLIRRVLITVAASLRSEDMAGDAVTVVLPCLNEEESLPAVLAAIPAGYRALVVDNNSTDDTATVAARHGAQVVVEPRPGYGSAVHAGVLAATTPIVAVIDADGSMDAGDLPKLVAELDKGADLVTGRRRPVAGLHWPWVARVGTVVMSWRLRTRHRLPVHDIAPMRVARREALLDLGVVDRRSGYPLELLVRAAAAGWRVVELDVSYGPRTGGKSKVSGSLRGSIIAILDFWKVIS
ncbi:glycosyl transferase family protein [Mycobacterium tuberculosis]|nr:glycosyl transferase family protein [Mycobacterium tuberculosis]